MNAMKKSAVITGLFTSRKKKNSIDELKNFIYTEMGVECEIDDIFFLSPHSTSPMVATFSQMQDKINVFSALKNLKGLVNEYEKPFTFNHYLPAEMNETRRRENEIIKQNEALEAEKLDIIRDKGKLIIEDQPYEKAVRVPTVKEILAIEVVDFDRAMESEIYKGKTILEKDSSFTGYVTSIQTHQQVMDAYRKMKVQFASASHIVCCYRIPGTRKFECEDYCDDRDSSCGRTLLEWMIANDITCRAIFVVRASGREKLGPYRFKCYVEAAKAAIEKAPINSVNNVNEARNLSGWEERRPARPMPVTNDTSNDQDSVMEQYRPFTRRKELHPSKSDRRRDTFRKRSFQPRGAASNRGGRARPNNRNLSRKEPDARNGASYRQPYNEVVKNGIANRPVP